MIWKILVVDDARAVIDSLQETLRRLGLDPEHIFIASDVQGALNTFREQQPTVVFMDVDLAGEKGEDVAKQILDEAPSTKVVIMTGMDPDDARVRGVVSAGAFDVIQKPLRLSRLKQVIELIDSEEKGLRRI